MTSKTIDRAIARLNRRKQIVQGLISKRAAKKAVVKTTSVSARGARKFPRGVLTFAVAEVLSEAKRPMPVQEIIEQVEEKIPGGGESVHQLLVSSNRFESVKRGVYKLNGGKPKGTLFKNLELATA